MKKHTTITLFLIVIIICGCATTQTIMVNYQSTEQLKRVVKIQNDIAIQIFDYPTSFYKIGIIDNPEPNAHVSSKDKVIAVTQGLLSLLNDSELTTVLLHEAAHVKFNHAESRKVASQGIQLAFTVLGVFIPGAGYANVLVNPLVTTAYSRSQELEADEDAVKVGLTISITPDVYIRSLEKLKQSSVDDDKSRAGLLDTHPNLEYRINQIKEKFK